MAHAEPEELAALALDDVDVPAAARDHVAGCSDCRALVADLTVVRQAAGGDALVPPPAGVRDRVLAETARTDPAPPGVVPLVRPSRRAVPVWLTAAAAAAALVVGVGLGQVLGDDQPDGADSTVVAATDLTTVEGEDPRGVASVVRSDDVVVLHVEATGLEDADGLREVWLLNVDGTRMVSLGLLAAGEEGDFEMPQRLLDQGYRIVDISVEPDDGDPAHSGVSVARGELV